MQKPSRIHRFIFNAFKPVMTALVYEQPKKVLRPELKWVFKCSDGLDYFMFDKPNKMPLMRQFAFIKAYNEFILKFTNVETDAMFKAIKKALEDKVPDLGMIFHILLQYDLRKNETFFNKEALYELFAICLVNDKEPYKELSEAWKKAKIETFTYDFEHGLKEVIYGSPLKEFIPQLENMEKFLTELTEEANIKATAFIDQLNSYSGG